MAAYKRASRAGKHLRDAVITREYTLWHHVYRLMVWAGRRSEFWARMAWKVFRHGRVTCHVYANGNYLKSEITGVKDQFRVENLRKQLEEERAHRAGQGPEQSNP